MNIKIVTGDDLDMSDFSSLKFSQFYLSGDIAVSCKLYMIQLTESGINIINDIDACNELIHLLGGFRVLG